MPLGEPDRSGPNLHDLQWLRLLGELVFRQADVKVLVGDSARTGEARVRVEIDGAYQDLRVPLPIIANRDWREILKIWRVDSATAFIVQNSKLVH